MPFSLGIAEVLFIFAILLLVFGAKRLPEIGSAMGKSIRDFKRSINGLDAPLDRDTLPESREEPAAAERTATEAEADPR